MYLDKFSALIFLLLHERNTATLFSRWLMAIHDDTCSVAWRKGIRRRNYWIHFMALNVIRCNQLFAAIKCFRRKKLSNWKSQCNYDCETLNLFLNTLHICTPLQRLSKHRPLYLGQFIMNLLTWNIHITAIHRPSMAIMWLIHFCNICPFICPWVVALHSSFKKKMRGKKRTY